MCTWQKEVNSLHGNDSGIHNSNSIQVDSVESKQSVCFNKIRLHLHELYVLYIQLSTQYTSTY